MAGVAGVAGPAGAFGPTLLRPFGGVAGSSCLRFSTITRAGRSPCGVGGSSSSVTSTSSSSASMSADTAPVDMVGERRGGCCGVHVCGVRTRKGSDMPLSPERRPAPMSSPVSPRSSISTAVSSRTGPCGEAILASTPGLSARARAIAGDDVSEARSPREVGSRPAPNVPTGRRPVYRRPRAPNHARCSEPDGMAPSETLSDPTTAISLALLAPDAANNSRCGAWPRAIVQRPPDRARGSRPLRPPRHTQRRAGRRARGAPIRT